MKPAKIFKLFKKGSKAASGRGKKKTTAKFAWPAGVRLGLFGHTNSGKTVFYSVLNEECKISRDLQLSVTDHATANELLKHYRSIWGLSTAVDAGTAVDMAGEKKFPESTAGELPYLFNATLDRGTKVSVVGYEYNGKSVALSAAGEEAEKVEDFMCGCDGLLFLYDPKLLKAEIENHAHVASFANMVEKLAPLGAKLPIPVGVVVTKSDILPGFTGEEQTVLVPAEDESLLAEEYEELMERVLASNRIAKNSKWAGTVREILIRLQPFLKIVVGRTLDFQIFFTSSTGTTPEKIGTEVGRSIYAPPRVIRPVGVKEPFYWILNAILRNRKISLLRKITRWVTTAAIIWAIAYSIPHLYHFNYLLPRTQQVEESIMDAYEGNIYSTSDEERGKIGQAYRRYEDSWIVKGLFPGFVAPSGRIRNAYRKFDVSEAVKVLNQSIDMFTAVVSDSALWPSVNPSDNSLILAPEHERLLSSLRGFQKGDETSELFTRSGRVLTYWELFAGAIVMPNDTSSWNVIKRQVEQDQSLYAREVNSSEKKLGEALSLYKVQQVSRVIAQETAYDFDDQIMANVNGNTDPKYRLEQAVRELRRVASKLDRSDTKHHNMIDKYLKDAKKWARSREYKCKIETLPGGGHLHIEVTDAGKDPMWSEINQIFEGDEITLKWKSGQDIHIALDTTGHQCQLGKAAADRVVKKGKYALFELEKGVSFSNVGKQVTIRFEPSLVDRLPSLE